MLDGLIDKFDYILLTVRGPFYQHRLTLISAWISNHMSSNVGDEISYSSPNFDVCTVDILEWISHYILHFMMDVITYPC